MMKVERCRKLFTASTSRRQIVVRSNAPARSDPCYRMLEFSSEHMNFVLRLLPESFVSNHDSIIPLNLSTNSTC